MRTAVVLLTVFCSWHLAGRARADWGGAEKLIAGQRNNRPVFCVGTFGSRAKEQGQYAASMKNTIEFIFDNKRSEYGHFQVRVGEKVYHLYGTRKAEAMPFKDYGMYDNPQVGAVFPVSEATLRTAQAAMDKAAQGAQQCNFPHFSISKKEPLFVKTKGKGRWMNLDTKRADNVAVGQLRRIGGQLYFVAENGYREPVKLERRRGFRPECKTCTSFVTDPLLEHAFKDLPGLKSFVARGLAGQLFSACGSGIQPAAFTYYHPEDKNPADLGAAFSSALK